MKKNTTIYDGKGIGPKPTGPKPASIIIDKSKIDTTDEKGSGFGMKPILNDEKTTTQTDSNKGCSCKKRGENSGGGCSCRNNRT